jgi:hypothetical protein
MKITPLLIGACLMAIAAGCHTPQSNEVIGAGVATIKTTALASITAKYPDMSSSDLKFWRLVVRTARNGEEEVVVSYKVPATAKTTTQGGETKTTTEIVGVEMSLSGQVVRVSRGGEIVHTQ